MKINHIGIVVKSLDKSLEYYKTLFEFEQISEFFYDENQKVRIVFIKIPDQEYIFELIEPVGDDSPVKIALKKGGGMNHICYQVDDIDYYINRFRRNGSKLLSGPVPAIAFHDNNIAFLYTKNNEIVELVENGKNV